MWRVLGITAAVIAAVSLVIGVLPLTRLNQEANLALFLRPAIPHPRTWDSLQDSIEQGLTAKRPDDDAKNSRENIKRRPYRGTRRLRQYRGKSRASKVSLLRRNTTLRSEKLWTAIRRPFILAYKRTSTTYVFVEPLQREQPRRRRGSSCTERRIHR